MKSVVADMPKNTKKIKVTVENSEVMSIYNKVVDETVKNAEIKGFRKGMAPKEMVMEKVDMAELNGEVVNRLLQTYYPLAIKENNIKGVANPRVEIQSFDISKDFEFTAQVPQKPDIAISGYKERLKNLKESQGDKKDQITSGMVIDTLLECATLEIPEIMIEDEVNRMLTRLVDQLNAVGLKMDAYLESQKRTSEELKADYSERAEKTLKAEFVLDHLIEVENIVVEESEVDEMISTAPDEKTKERLKDPMERWYLKHILQKNALLSKLMEDGDSKEHSHDHGHDHHDHGHDHDHNH